MLTKLRNKFNNKLNDKRYNIIKWFYLKYQLYK